MVTQALLIRQLVVVFWGNELSLGIIFASWFFWIAGGSLGLGRFADRVKGKIKAYIGFQVLVSLVLIPVFLGIKAIRVFWAIPPGELIGLFPFLTSTFLLLSLPCLIFGFQFALACRIYAQEKARQNSRVLPKAAGRIYLFDALGNMLGGITFAYLLVNVFYPFETIFSLAILNLSLALILTLWFLKKRGMFCLGIIFLLIVFVYSIMPPRIDCLHNYANRLEWKDLSIQETDFSKYGDYAVIKDGDSFYLYGNGRLLFSVPEKSLPEEIIHLSLSQIQNPERILLIGGGLSGAIAQGLKYSGIKEIFCLERDAKFVHLAKKYIIPQDKQALIDSRTNIVIDDGRLFVKKYRGERFDAVILNSGNPLTAELNRFYTRQFFKEAKRILKPEGVLFLGVDSHENYLSLEMRKFNSCIYRTLKQVFPQVVFFPGARLYFACSSENKFLTDSPGIISRRLNEQKIFSQYINEYTLPHRLSPERLSYVREILSDEEKKGGRLNQDFRPISYYYNLILWGSKVFPQKFTQIFWRLSRIKFGWIASGVMAICLFLIAGRQKLGKFFIPLSVFIGGLAGISLELILIIGFQILYGNLYFMIGLIIACFMLGVVIGAGLISRRLEKIKNKVLALSRIELSLGIYALAVVLVLLMLNFWPGTPFFVGTQIFFPLLTVLAGFWVGMIFPLANSIYSPRVEMVGRMAGRLYGFDLLGACLGSLSTTVFFIPLFGLIQTGLLMAMICVCGSILLLTQSHLGGGT